jgi:hypothetical protein
MENKIAKASVPRDNEYEIAELNQDRDRILIRMNILIPQKIRAKKLLNELIIKSKTIKDISKEIERLSLIILFYNRELNRIDNEIENFIIDDEKEEVKNEEVKKEEVKNEEVKNINCSKFNCNTCYRFIFTRLCAFNCMSFFNICINI